MARDDGAQASAGDGYTHLTRQVSSADVQRAAGQSLSGYYADSGNPPGVWCGTGAAVLGVSGVVSEGQMRALVGAGLHPDADRRQAQLQADGLSEGQAAAAVRLGRPFGVYAMGTARRAVAGYDLVFTR